MSNEETAKKIEFEGLTPETMKLIEKIAKREASVLAALAKV